MNADFCLTSVSILSLINFPGGWRKGQIWRQIALSTTIYLT